MNVLLWRLYKAWACGVNCVWVEIQLRLGFKG
jgi:hypothetical protein